MLSKKTNPLPSLATSPLFRPVKEEKIDATTPASSPAKEDIATPTATPHEGGIAAEEQEGEREREEREGEGEGNALPKSVTRLRGLSFALSSFTRGFLDMENHLRSIQQSILEKSKELDSMKPQKNEDPPHHIQQELQKPQKEEDPPQQKQEKPQKPQKKEDPPHQDKERPPPQQKKKKDPPHQNQEEPLQQPKEEEPSKPPVLPDLKLICRTMNSKGLRKYIATRMNSDMGLLRDEVSESLKFAPNPGRLVLHSIGRFYLQGGKAFVRDSSSLKARNLAIVLFELFILSGCSEFEASVKDEAESVAKAWRSRLVHEGGICSASCEDALALLLFIAAFGIPADFGMGDVCELIRVSNLQEKADVLLHSPLFLGKFHDIIQGMVDKGLHVFAVDLSCALGLEHKFSPKSMLSCFVTEATKTAKKMRREGLGNHEKLKEACEKHLAALKSVIKCLEDHKIDSAGIAPWDINMKITKLEKEVTNFSQRINEKAVPKRKAIQHGSFEDKTQAKRHQPATHRVVSQPPSSVPQPQEQHLNTNFVSQPPPSVPQPQEQHLNTNFVSQPPPSVPQPQEQHLNKNFVSQPPAAVTEPHKQHLNTKFASQPPSSVPQPQEQHLNTKFASQPPPSVPQPHKQHLNTNFVSQPPPSVPQPHEQHLNGLIAKYTGGGFQASLNGLPGAAQSNGSGLLWGGSTRGAVAGTSAGQAAGAVPLMPSGSGSVPSVGSGMGLLPLWTGNTLGAMAGTSAGLAAAAGKVTPSGAGTFMGSGIDPCIRYGNGMPIGTGIEPLANSGQEGKFGFMHSAGQRLLGPSPSTLEGFPGLLSGGSGSSHLFDFVDTVLKGESSHRNSSQVGNRAPAASSSAYHASYY